MPYVKRTIFTISVACFLISVLNGQPIPQKPVSFRVFTPFIFNPAVTGSHDYGSLDLDVSFQGESKAQLASLNTRLTRARQGYFSSPGQVTYLNSGMGGYIFRKKNPVFHTSGAGFSYAYHIPLNRTNFSFLAFGAALKGYFTSPGESGGSEPAGTSVKGLHPDMDLGAYYYGTNFYAGFSSTSIFGRRQEVQPGEFALPVSRQYFLLTGYKFIIAKSLSIIFEPSLISRFDSFKLQKAVKNFKPVLKLYMQDFCIGTYFHDKDKNAFFFQYRYPRFHLGGYFALPKESPYYPKDVIVEITAGITFAVDKARLAQ